MVNKKQNLKKQRIEGAIYGFIVGVCIWITLAIYFLLDIGFKGLINLVAIMHGKYQLMFFVNLLILPVIFSIFGIAIGPLLYKLKSKKHDYKSTFGSLALFVVLVMVVLNIFISPIIGGPFSFLPIENVIVRNIVLFGVTYLIGWFIGKLIEENKK